ncbi:kelch-like protein 25 [Babylonia areolata]|uniref:kelch-like protein 25 n=1 Tax=Babylonia areolata TaxID=304850 RepID=UPI003FD3548C
MASAAEDVTITTTTVATTTTTTSQPPDFRHRHLCDITSGLVSLWRRGLYTDLNLVVEGKVVKCHRVVLASASSYFHARLYSGKQHLDSAATDKLFVQDVSRDMVLDVLQFVYTGSCPLRDDNAEEVLRAAVLFQMATLRDACDFFLKDRVHVWNAVRWYKRTLEVIVRHLRQLWPTRLFKQLTLQELLPILCYRNTLRKNASSTSSTSTSASKDRDVLEAVLAWVKADLTRRKGSVDEMFSRVCLLKWEEVVKEDRRSSERIREVLAQWESERESERQQSRGLPQPQPQDRAGWGNKTIRFRILSPRSLQEKPKLDDVLVLVGGVEAVVEEGEEEEPCDSGSASCLHGNDIFVCGGEGGARGRGSRRGLVKYDNNDNSWMVLAPMAVGRRGHCLVAMDDCLYVFGGAAAAATLAEPVSEASAVAFHGQIHVFGGFQGKGKATTIVQTFDPACASSSSASPLCRVTSQPPLPMQSRGQRRRRRCRVVILGPSGHIVTTRDCRTFRVAACIPGFRRALFGIALQGSWLYVAGGRCGDRVYGDVLMVDVDHATLIRLQEPLPRPVWGGGLLRGVVAGQSCSRGGGR